MPTSKKTNSNSKLPVKAERTISFDDFRTMYHMLNARPDTDIKLFWEKKKVHLADLIELNNRVEEKVRNHSMVTNLVKVSIVLSDNHMLEFNSWNAFEKTNWETSPYTESITIIWEMNFVLPNHKLPQAHTMKLKLGSPLKPSEMFHVMFTEDYHEIDKEFANAICTVCFINPVICNELFGIVKEWHEALSTIYPENKLISIVRKHPDRFHLITRSIVLLGGVLCLLGITHTFIEFYDPSLSPKLFVEHSYQWIIISAFVMYILYIIGEGLAKWTAEKIKRLSSLPVFGITKGDKNRADEVIVKNRKLLKEAFIHFLASVILLVVGALTHVIIHFFQKLFS